MFLFLRSGHAQALQRVAEQSRGQGLAPTGGRGYLLLDIEQLRSFGTASGYAAVVVFSLYINSHDVVALSPSGRMWLIVPLMILWISRVWLLAGRGRLRRGCCYLCSHRSHKPADRVVRCDGRRTGDVSAIETAAAVHAILIYYSRG